MSTPQTPEEPKPGEILEGAVGKMVVGLARQIARYAVDHLAEVVYTKDGQVRLDEVHEYLRSHVTNINELTLDHIADALENAGEKYFSFDYIDQLISGIGNRILRGSLNTGMNWAKSQLHHYPNFVKELQEDKDTILLTFLAQDPSTAETYRLLKDRPKLTKFITEAFFVKMGIPLEKAAPTTPPAGVQ
jgi:hypothetical protein